MLTCTSLNSKFFSNPNGSKAPSKQSKLAFSSKPVPQAKKGDDVETEDGHGKKANVQQELEGGADDNVEMKDGDSYADVKPKVKKEKLKENVELGKDIKKRSRFGEQKSESKTEKKQKAKKEVV